MRSWYNGACSAGPIFVLEGKDASVDMQYRILKKPQGVRITEQMLRGARRLRERYEASRVREFVASCCYNAIVFDNCGGSAAKAMINEEGSYLQFYSCVGCLAGMARP